MSNLEHFTIQQLKKLVKHFDLKNIKISVKKPQLINQIDKHVHFDGYMFHLKDSNEDNLVKPDILKKEPRQYIKTNQKDINNKQMSNINQSIQDIISMLVPSKKNKKKPVIDEFGNFELVEPKPKKIKIKKIYKNEEDTDLFPVLPLIKKKIKVKKPTQKSQVEEFFKVEPKKYKKIRVKKAEAPKQLTKIKNKRPNIIKAEEFEF
jgi:hypothetical protein